MVFLFYFFFSFMLSFEGKQIVGDPFFPIKEFKKSIYVQISKSYCIKGNY